MAPQQPHNQAGRRIPGWFPPLRQHLREFVRTPLWRGILPAFLSGFGVVALLCLAHYGTGSSKVLSAALLTGGLCALCYAIGIWGATGPDSDEEDEEREEAETESSLPLWLRRTILVGLLLIALGAVAWPSLQRIMEGQRTLFDGCIEIVGKLLTLVCVVVPIRIAERRR